MKKRVFRVLRWSILLLSVGIVVEVWQSLPIISGYGAKVLCSAVFVAGRDPDAVVKSDLGSFPLYLGSYRVNRADSSVTGSVWGLAVRKAVYRKGLGATLLSGVSEEELRRQPVRLAIPPVVDADTVDWPMGDRLPGEDVVRDTAALRSAIDRAFREEAGHPAATRAVVVVWHGRLVGERYAPGFDRHSRLAGWSMTKGITSALLGILVRQGKLDIRARAPVPVWKEDERSRITIDDLMHMRSGLRWWEFYAGPSSATTMLFKERDMGVFAMRRSLRHPPGEVFNYSSGTANILSSIIRQTIGDSSYYRFPYEELFYKIGMYSAVLEPDAGGTFVGSSYCYATARDWARFGLLYLRDGVWKGARDSVWNGGRGDTLKGERILPEGWVSFTRAGGGYGEAGKGYGGMWWLGGRGLPADCYSCNGYEGQYVWVVPSKDLVVVRLALEHGHKLRPGEFLPGIIRALR